MPNQLQKQTATISQALLVYPSTCLYHQSASLTCACLPVYLFISSVGLAHLCLFTCLLVYIVSRPGSPVLVYLSTCLHHQSDWLTCACLPVYLFTSSVGLAHLCLFTCLLVYIVSQTGSPVLVYLSTCLPRQSAWLTCAARFPYSIQRNVAKLVDSAILKPVLKPAW